MPDPTEEPILIDPKFAHRKLTPEGEAKARWISEGFSLLLEGLNKRVPPGRELALAVTHLETACTFAKKGMAMADGNHE